MINGRVVLCYTCIFTSEFIETDHQLNVCSLAHALTVFS